MRNPPAAASEERRGVLKSKQFAGESRAKRNQAGLEELGISDRKHPAMQVYVSQSEGVVLRRRESPYCREGATGPEMSRLHRITTGFQDAGCSKRAVSSWSSRCAAGRVARAEGVKSGRGKCADKATADGESKQSVKQPMIQKASVRKCSVAIKKRLHCFRYNVTRVRYLRGLWQNLRSTRG